ncbi:hypothetical protein SAMN05428988_0011 [Chitinophaga sp. YR573]|uniref:hypothetical protein n=1 Tax=Chitinophaga sp. YR573 TaxID=1881040 RepID=UPI0008B09867|nr:hypothetical protein [Chitinophaga sp. YR573]SEV87546.1 hypothetical protein SAMN05428988_0011 [Chitinophaga sp. YR573]
MKNLFLLCLFMFDILASSCFGQKDTTSIAGISLENPTGLGGYLGTIGIGIAGQHKTRAGRKPDANAGVYIGLGDPLNYVGLGASLSISGLSNTRGTRNNLGESGVNVEISKLIFNSVFLKAGICNITYLGETYHEISAQRSFYGAGTVFLGFSSKKLGKPFSYIAITAGAGNGLFRKDKDFTPTSSGHFNPFLSIATPVLLKTNIIAEWTGYDISTGISSNIAYLIGVPLNFSLEITDYQLGKLRCAMSIGYSFNVLKKHKYEKK